MFGPRIELFKLFGIPIRIDLSWLVVFALITWSLATVIFPTYIDGLSAPTYWWMGVAGALGLFASILFHELSHALVARRFGLSINGITLFIFGGVAEMEDEPPSPIAELLVAIAGPIASAAIAASCLFAAAVGYQPDVASPVFGVLWYLGLINAILVAFNLIPAFPLDGGRILRSILWQMRGNLRWATRVTSSIGSVFGLILMVFGGINVLSGNLIGGMWQFLIGMFLRAAAQMSYQQLSVRRALEGEVVSRFMQTDVHTSSPSMTVEELVENYIYRQHHKMYPVVDEGRLLGYVTTADVKKVPREEWGYRTVGEIYTQYGETNTIAPQVDALAALSKMSQTGSSRLLVVDDGELIGVIVLKDLLRFISLKVELEDEDELASSQPKAARDAAARARGEDESLHTSV